MNHQYIQLVAALKQDLEEEDLIGLLFSLRLGSFFGGFVTETFKGREGDVTST